MSTFPPIATELRTSLEVRNVPTTDSCTATYSGGLDGQFCYAARSTRVSISLRSVPKSIGLVSSASAPFSNALRLVSASP